MATGGASGGASSGEDELPIRKPRRRHTIRRHSSVACDTNIRSHRGSFSEHENIHDDDRNAEVEREGEVLYEYFLTEQIRRAGLQVQDERLNQVSRELQVHKEWAVTGTNLRSMADSFAKTQERVNVAKLADKVDASGLTSVTFRELLMGLFGQGITRERIVALFFFTSDVAIRLLRQKAVDIFRRLMDWTLEFIRDCVCCWVADHGGWGAVLSSSFQLLRQVIIFGTIVIAAFSCYKYLMK